ncbi:site-specific integrase [Hymenobacter volaticus]|uniref:Site-specific integrase n=1 Tax=Hymenobacter volaticus TaxID=2932254 RepID=A0ABY4G5B8_9BACT|nr:site-specific integrase [Hymenobacter volaticus]UOQ65724.1 site-specific integrase [Hymenobacter volaticus]
MSKTTDQKEGQATVKVVYYTYKTLADGSHPFMVRITKNRKLKYKATGYSLHPDYWNEKKKEIRRSYPGDVKALWRKLEAKAAAYEKAAEDLAEADEQHDAETVFRKVSEARKATRRVKLLAYIEELAAGMVVAGQVGNSTVYRDLGNQLAKFIGAQANAPEPPLGKGQEAEKATWIEKFDVPCDRVTVSFCNEWEATLRATKVEEITLSLRFRTLRAVLNKAIAAGLAKTDNYPFARNAAERHKFQVGKFDVTTAKRAVTRDELRKLEALTPSSERMQLAKDVFLFSFYCGGINFVDLAQLRWCDLNGNSDGQRLSYVRQKTKGKFSLKLLDPAVIILDTYRPFTLAGRDSYIFPVLDKNKHKDAKQIKNRLHKVLGQVNKDLKLLGEESGISTTLTTYVARHSFATTLKLSGAATGIISQAMGHKSEAVTAVYLDSFASDLIDNAYKGLL